MKKLDVLSVAFCLAAICCLLVSVPATYQMATLVHGRLLAFALVAVFELMAFGAKLGSRWVPGWSGTLDTITKTLLVVTTLANFASGWDALWGQQLTGFWAGVRDWSPAGAPVGAIAATLVLSALVPAAIYLFLSLFVRRQLELEDQRRPAAVAERAIEPLLVLLEQHRQTQHALQQLVGPTQHQLVTPQLDAPQPVLPVAQPPVAKQPAPAAGWQCAQCGAPGNISQKGVAQKWATARGQIGLLCKDCRAQQ